VFGLAAAGLLVVALTFGTVMAAEFPTVAHNTTYGLIVFVLMWFARYNTYSIDHLIRDWRSEHRH
jgi:hypothetical protein